VTRRLPPTLLLFAAGLWLACHTAAPAPTPEQATEARRVLVAWFECEECWDGELEAVLALGKRAVPQLAATLDGGLSPATRAALEDQLGAYYDEAEKRDAGPRGWPRDAYVAHHVVARDAAWRSRAAEALGRIGGPHAEHALREAAARPQLPNVEQSIRDALARF
jgi:hypothetical protein